MSSSSSRDSSIRFLFNEADIRGELVSLDQSFNELVGGHGYSPTTACLLGQFAVAALLISNNLKYQGRIILQARSDSALSLIMVECSSERQIRGIARGDVSAVAENPLSLINGGQLALTIERDGGQRYQGIVALDGDSLSSALNNYFYQSEQLHTRFYLAAQPADAAGMMLQQLPGQITPNVEQREEQWRNAEMLAETLTASELLTLAPAEVLHRLFNEHDLKVFSASTVVFQCRCTRQRSLDALSLLPTSELEEALAESDSITMHCEMCGKEYAFQRTDLPTLADSRVLH